MSTQTQPPPVGQAGKYVSFRLGSREYAVEILKVQEINGTQGVVSVPLTPAWVRGVIDLRGRAVPVADLRLILGLSATKQTDRTSIIYVQVPQPNGELLLGLVVDEVAEILNIENNEIGSFSQRDDFLDTPFILGRAQHGQRDLILLDVDRLLGDEGIQGIITAMQ
jgi:purine-binding chemotaxis protein CheW